MKLTARLLIALTLCVVVWHINEGVVRESSLARSEHLYMDDVGLCEHVFIYNRSNEHYANVFGVQISFKPDEVGAPEFANHYAISSWHEGVIGTDFVIEKGTGINIKWGINFDELKPNVKISGGGLSEVLADNPSLDNSRSLEGGEGSAGFSNVGPQLSFARGSRLLHQVARSNVEGGGHEDQEQRKDGYRSIRADGEPKKARLALGTLLSSALCFCLVFPFAARGADAWSARALLRGGTWFALCGAVAVIGALGPAFGFDLWTLSRSIWGA